jgi:hypothetical protein
MLEPWEQELLQHTELATDPRSVCVALESGVLAVSDGSEWSQQQGAFGWSMSTSEGERVATGMGLVRGSKHNSYRSEAYGLLSLLCFLIRLAEFTHLEESWEGHLATDSQSLLDTLFGIKDKRQLLSTLQSSQLADLDVMIPEWDILILIQERMRKLPGIDIQHIKGHQDKYKAYEELTLMAQLNVDADSMASLYQREYGHPSKDTLLSTTAGAVLNLTQGTVTAHHAAAMHIAASGPPLLEYVRRKNGWTLEISNKINWEAHSKALAGHRNKSTQCVKLVHDILPTNAYVHRQSPTRQKCPLCTDIKDRDHILRCKHPSREQWRKEFLTSLNHYCSTAGTCQTLTHILLLALQRWFREDPNGAQSMTLDEHQFPNDVRLVIQQQNKIGWRQIFSGRFGRAWGEYQERHYSQAAEQSRAKVHTGQLWQKNMIMFIWAKWFLLWSMRNQDVHGADENTRRQLERAAVISEIRELHDARSRMEPRVQGLLPQDLGDHISQSTWINVNWLRIHGPTMRESIQRAKELAIRGTRSIQSYFKSKSGMK